MRYQQEILWATFWRSLYRPGATCERHNETRTKSTTAAAASTTTTTTTTTTTNNNNNNNNNNRTIHDGFT